MSPRLLKKALLRTGFWCLIGICCCMRSSRSTTPS